jgi:hypothetical protein
MRVNSRRTAWALTVAGALVVPLAVVAHAAVVTPTDPRAGSLVQVGPITDTGYPQWYRDSNGIRLEACATLTDQLCQPLPDEVPNPNEPVSYPDNFPVEHFYFMSESSVAAANAGTVDVVMNLEGAWAVEEVREGDQIVFGRIRIRARDAADGEYRVVHPYGIDEFTAAGGDGIDMTEDIGIAPRAFGGAIQSRIGPFLTWDTFGTTGADAPPAGYIGDPGVEHRVKGSPYGTNFVRVDQKVGGEWVQVGYNDLFSVQGRLAVNDGVDVQQATYKKVDGRTVVEIFASSEAGEAIRMVAPELGYRSVTLAEDNYAVAHAGTSTSHLEGRYYGRFAVKGGVEVTGGADATQITVQNAGDVPVANKKVKLSDVVTVTGASYDGSRLTVEASSSDPGATVTVEGYGPVTGGVGTFDDVDAPPHVITVTSDEGGSVTVPLSTSGPYTQPDLPVAVATSTPTRPIAGQPVKLDASGSLDATSYEWSVVEIPATSKTAVLSDTTAVAPTFTPDRAGTYTFSVVAIGESGRSPSQMITVQVMGVQAQVTAKAGPAQTVRRGTTVTLNGSESIGAATYAWEQLPFGTQTEVPAGLKVTLDNPTSAKPTFRFPLMTLPKAPGPNSTYNALGAAGIRFRLTVTGVDGTTQRTSEVNIKPEPEVLAVTEARYRTRGEWRISGTSSTKAGQQVAIILDARMNTAGEPTLASARGKYIGLATVDTLGGWSYVGPGPNPRPTTGLASSQVTAVSAQGGQGIGVITVSG